jgi:ribosome assembly protein YihI (activator of Der GTPase)
MTTRYVINDGQYYLLLDRSQISREISNLEWCVKKAKDRIAHLQKQMELLDEDSDEYDGFEEETNDLRMLIDDFTERFEDIINLPKLPLPK